MESTNDIKNINSLDSSENINEVKYKHETKDLLKDIDGYEDKIEDKQYYDENNKKKKSKKMKYIDEEYKNKEPNKSGKSGKSSKAMKGAANQDDIDFELAAAQAKAQVKAQAAAAKEAEKQKVAQLKKQLSIITTSYETLQIIIFAIVLSGVNLNKLRLQLIDQLNGTNNADSIPDTTLLPWITSILLLYGTYVFVTIAEQSYKEAMKTSTDPNNDPNVKSTYESYLAGLLVFIAAIVRFANLVSSKNTTEAAQDISAATTGEV